MIVEANAIRLNLNNTLFVEPADDFLKGFFTHAEKRLNLCGICFVMSGCKTIVGLEVINNYCGFRGWCMWGRGARLACVDLCLHGAPTPTLN